MRELSPKERDMIYPAECHFKVIAEGEEVQARITMVLRRQGITSPVCAGNMSSTGRYQTFNVTVQVDNHDTMVTLEKALRNIEGVKKVL